MKPHVTFVKRGTVHNDEQTSGADRVVRVRGEVGPSEQT
jgi:hypothetical protein